MEKQTRVFQIGYNKCGTRAIRDLFRRNGFRCVHWDQGRLAKTMFRNLKAGRSLIHGYEDYDIFTDMECMKNGHSLEGYKLYPELAKEFPLALFLLNTRDRERWIQSRMQHQDGKLAQDWKRHYGVSSDDHLQDCWRKDWDSHHEQVKAFFANSPYRLVIFDIERDPPAKLAEAMPEVHLDPSKYRKTGTTEEDKARREARRVERPAAEGA
ncbi:MAG: hypothetical protein JO056_08935 [Alphaproteobacteria bacterium]|nr:hypothetical protein [Alphaproteobacteria bacterium]